MYKVPIEVLVDIKNLLGNITLFQECSVKDQKEAERLKKILEDNYYV